LVNMDSYTVFAALQKMKALQQKNVPAEIVCAHAAKAIRNAELTDKLMQTENCLPLARDRDGNARPALTH